MLSLSRLPPSESRAYYVVHLSGLSPRIALSPQVPCSSGRTRVLSLGRSTKKIQGLTGPGIASLGVIRFAQSVVFRLETKGPNVTFAAMIMRCHHRQSLSCLNAGSTLILICAFVAVGYLLLERIMIYADSLIKFNGKGT